MEDKKEVTAIDQSRLLTELRFKQFEEGYSDLIQKTGIRITAKAIISENGSIQMKYESSMIPGWGM